MLNLDFRFYLYAFVALLFSNTVVLACDTTPSLTVSNVIDNGDDTFYMDITACIGSEGSADGFDLYFNNDINILGTTVTEIESPGLGNVATVSVSNGVWLAYFEEYDINGTYFENGAWGLDCIEFGVIVDDNPEGATLCSAGMNEDCLGWTFDDVFITCAVIPGPCVPNYSITDNGTIDGDVSLSGQNCNFAPLNDEIVELTVTCDGEFNFSLTQDESIGWPGESWLTIALGCCSGVLEQTMSFFLEPTLTIDTYLTEGTYYVIVDIEGNGFPGDYILDITSSADVGLVTTANAGEDQVTCEEDIVLNGNPTLNDNEIGTWSIVSGSGNFIEPNNPNTTVTNLLNGENLFQWEIANECSNSTDLVAIEVANNIVIDAPETVYCLDDISLSAIGANNTGEWSVTPEFNIEINDINSDNTFATVTAYGTYTFTYTICDEEFSTVVNVESITPNLSSPSNTYYCLESFSLMADVDGDPGYWDYEGPFIANINNPISLNPTVTVNGYGTYTFTYYGCGSSNSIQINMAGSPPNAFGEEETYCLEPIELNAQVDGDPGYWSFEGPGNAIFSQQNELTTTVTVDEYGTYFFTYNGCGESSNTIVLNSLIAQPQIIEPEEELTIYCDLNTNLEAYVLGDPGYWDYDGPGTAIFENQNSQATMVTVDQYGTYSFTYYGCGTASYPIIINFEVLEPMINGDEIIYCELNNELTASVYGSEGIEWFINNQPTNADATLSNLNSANTTLTVSDYGIYEIGLNGCGSTVFTEISFEPVAPHIIAPNFQNCILTATLIAYTDDPSGGGPWVQESGPEGVVFSNIASNMTEITVPDFGLYSFSYPACDTSSIISIGFECPLIFPNVLTPNNDGNNDFFIIQNLNSDIYTESILTIYNRWGSIIYNGKEYGLNEEWWNGKTTYNNVEIVDGVYYYVVEVFNNVKKQKETYSGELNVFISNSSSSNEE